MIGGRYRLDRTIGKGGMGYVWSGTDEVLERPVAVKELHLPANVPEEEAADLRERALREARAMATLSHPNTVMLYDVAREDDSPFVVMELVPGQSLSTILKRHRALNHYQLAVMMDGVAAALHAAHQVGIVHRDVKPGNVLLGPRGKVKLADFGLSRNTAEKSMTRSEVLLGTPVYLPPEIARRGTLGASADLWSLGATLYSAAEGHPPYDKTSDPLITISSIVHGPLPRHHQTGPVGEVLGGLLVKDPARRMPLVEVRRRLHELVKAAGDEPFEPLLDPHAPALTERIRPVPRPPAVLPQGPTGQSGQRQSIPRVTPTPPSNPRPLAGVSPAQPWIPPQQMRSAQPRRPAQSGSWQGQPGPPHAQPAPKRTAKPTPLVLTAGAVALTLVAGATVFGFVVGAKEPTEDSSTIVESSPFGSAYQTLQAEVAGSVGRSITEGTSDGTRFAGPLMAGDVLRFDEVEFGTRAANEMSVRFRTTVPESAHATMTVRMTSPNGEKVGQFDLVNASRGATWQTAQVKLARGLTGTRTVYLVISAEVGGEALQLDWVQFHR